MKKGTTPMTPRTPTLYQHRGVNTVTSISKPSPNSKWWRGNTWAVTNDGIERLDGAYFIAANRLFEDYPNYSWPEHIAGKGASFAPAEFSQAWQKALEYH